MSASCGATTEKSRLEPSRPRIFTATFVSELIVGFHVAGVGSLMVLLAASLKMDIESFAILGSFLGAGMVLNAATSHGGCTGSPLGHSFKSAPWVRSSGQF